MKGFVHLVRDKSGAVLTFDLGTDGNDELGLDGHHVLPAEPARGA